MDYSETEIPETGHAARQRRYRRTDKGKATKHRYQHRTSTWHSIAEYCRRPFLMWDGEGINRDDRHLYTLLASSQGVCLQNDDGLATSDIFDTLIQSKRDHPDAINVVYGASYDFNMWLTDVPWIQINYLYTKGVCYWQAYRIEWRQGKSFRVTDRRIGVTITVYDVVSFFQCAFVKACDDYLGDDFEERAMIVANKAARGTFTEDDNDTVRKYNDAELRNGVKLMTELRDRLVRATLRPKRWDGPGAIAAALLTREGVKNAMVKCPEPVADAGRFAYAGGRFEVIRCGDVRGTAYEYDVNSAYPHALRYVPNLRNGHWTYTTQPPTDPTVYGVYRCTWDAWPRPMLDAPQPLFRRFPKGQIAYPYQVTGWYWAPEVCAAALHPSDALTVHEGWVFVPDDPHDKPFAFVEEMYAKRQVLKAAGDGAHVGIKLGLNSLYGKTCQKVGWKPQTAEHGVKPPPFHQLEWAGYVTSLCRSMVFSAACQNLGSVIAFETDALFTSAPLDVPVGTGLGEWEFTEFSHLAYLQSGFYFGTTVNGKTISKTRGIDRGTMTYDDARKALQQPLARDRKVTAALTRFVGVGLARQYNDRSRWQQWETNPKRVIVEPTGKRLHPGCFYCDDSPGINAGVWHETVVPLGCGDTAFESCAYPIPWINPDPKMTELEEMSVMHREEDASQYE